MATNYIITTIKWNDILIECYHRYNLTDISFDDFRIRLENPDDLDIFGHYCAGNMNWEDEITALLDEAINKE